MLGPLQGAGSGLVQGSDGCRARKAGSLSKGCPQSTTALGARWHAHAELRGAARAGARSGQARSGAGGRGGMYNGMPARSGPST